MHAHMHKRVDVVKLWNQARVRFPNFEIRYLGKEQQRNRPEYIYSQIVMVHRRCLLLYVIFSYHISFYGYSFRRILPYFLSQGIQSPSPSFVVCGTIGRLKCQIFAWLTQGRNVSRTPWYVSRTPWYVSRTPWYVSRILIKKLPTSALIKFKTHRRNSRIKLKLSTRTHNNDLQNM